MLTKIEDVVTQLNKLIAESDAIFSNNRWYFDNQAVAAGNVLYNRLASAVERIAPPSSSYVKQLSKVRPHNVQMKFPEAYAIARALRDDLQAGWVESVIELVHADTYSDYLEMAEALLGKGYKDPAAVITGTSLEVHIRALCVKNGVTIAVAGQPKKAETMNADLKKASVYDGLQQKQVTAWMDLRNKAAHGKYADYDKNQVRLFIDGVQAFMMKYPA